MGKYDLFRPTGAPLAGNALLERGEENKIVRISSKEAIPRMMHQSLWRLELEQMERQLELPDDLLRTVPVWKLTCRNEDAAALSKEAITSVDQETVVGN